MIWLIGAFLYPLVVPAAIISRTAGGFEASSHAAAKSVELLLLNKTGQPEGGGLTFSPNLYNRDYENAQQYYGVNGVKNIYDKAGIQGPIKDASWFTEVPQKMAEMPPYPLDIKAAPRTDGPCQFACGWTCGTKECDQICTPQCAPPQCETLCMKSADKCETRCGPPKCAVVCPETECKGGSNCPKCRTVCAPPACTIECSDDCHSVCSKPECTWDCHPDLGKCPSPNCTKTCTGQKRCREGLPPPRNKIQVVPMAAGSKVVSEGVASIDPTVLNTPAEPPPPVTSPPVDFEWAKKKLKELTARPTLGPVAKLKRHWQVEDDKIEEARLLRR